MKSKASGGDSLKVSIELGADTWHEVPAEALWAKSLPDQTAVIDNIPFFAKGISLGDRVAFTTIQTAEGPLHRFDAVLFKSGNSTYRLRAQEEDAEELNTKLCSQLQNLGCAIERGSHMGFWLFAINIPASASADQTYALIERVVEAGLAEVEEGNDVHP